MIRLLLCMGLLTATTLRASINYGTALAGQGFPFTRAETPELYQQAYDASVFLADFNGPFLIDSFSFFDSFAGGPGATAITFGNYTIQFYVTPMPADALSSNFAANRGTLLSAFFSGPLGGPMQTVDFTVSGTPFLYDPHQGNLLIDIVGNYTGASGSGGFDLDFNSTLMGRNVSIGGTPGTFPGGLVTSFDATPLPEPSSIFLLSGGIVCMAASRRRAAVWRAARFGRTCKIKNGSRHHPRRAYF